MKVAQINDDQVSFTIDCDVKNFLNSILFEKIDFSNF